MSEYFVGLMSGTSMDGIDAVVVEFGERELRICASIDHPYPPPLRRALLTEIRKPLSEPVDTDGALHHAVGKSFTDAARCAIEASDIANSAIRAIGSHGQTLRHQPDAETPFSLQIGDPAIICDALGIPVVADFRSADIAVGGQGAPLVPPFHAWLFEASGSDRVVVNIGGIANVTLLPQRGNVTGFDTGPGNGLMDAWIREQRGHEFDTDGAWAASGEVDQSLLAAMLADPYFSLQPPKSTGFEAFNLNWIQQFDVAAVAPQDLQATLCELTAVTIAAAVLRDAPGTDELFVCGGGAHNTELLKRLGQKLAPIPVASTAAAGLHPDWVEACAFAWLARQRLANLPGNLPSVTGANKTVTLGELHYP